MTYKISESTNNSCHLSTRELTLRLKSVAERAPTRQQQIRETFEEIFVPELEALKNQSVDLGSEGFERLHLVLNSLKRFGLRSNEFPELAGEFVRNTDHAELLAQLRGLVSWSASIVERNASKVFIERLGTLHLASQRTDFFLTLTRPGGRFADRILDHERIPQLTAEVEESGIGADSRVVVLGSGPLPLSAIRFALAGARVLMLDRSERALQESLPILAAIPKAAAARIESVCFEAERVSELGFDPTHLLLAGMLDAKKAVLESLVRAWGGTNLNPKILVRTPRETLIQAYFYPADLALVPEYVVERIVDIGIEAGNRTLILRRRA